jgi:hypothetical protein
MLEDIRIIIVGNLARIGGLTRRGLDWLSFNMVTKPYETITVEKEYLDDIKSLIQKDGLTYKEK